MAFQIGDLRIPFRNFLGGQLDFLAEAFDLLPQTLVLAKERIPIDRRVAMVLDRSSMRGSTLLNI